MKCLKCAIKTNTVEKTVNRPHKCIDCINGIEHRICEECDEILVYCKIMRYGHDGNTPKKCMWFGKK